jgi:hypothetical protein
LLQGAGAAHFPTLATLAILNLAKDASLFCPTDLILLPFNEVSPLSHFLQNSFASHALTWPNDGLHQPDPGQISASASTLPVGSCCRRLKGKTSDAKSSRSDLENVPGRRSGIYG